MRPLVGAGGAAPAPRRPRLARGRRAAAWLALALLLAPELAACATAPRPWDVPPERRARFEETRRTCHLLTDGEGGTLRPEVFDRCMERRGFHRTPWWKLWN